MSFSGTYHGWVTGASLSSAGAGTLLDEDTTLTAGEEFTWGGSTFTFLGTVDGSATDFFAEFSGATYVFSPDPGAYLDGDPTPPGTAGGSTTLVCFVAGTRILTDRGEVEVEQLRAGDLVATLGHGGTVLAPVLFLGRRRILLAGNPQAEAMSPVRIRAGALAENTPHRDLLVSPDHCLFVDGALVPARLLVNGTSIVVEQGLAEVSYYHVELDCHDVLLAEGAAAESWLDCGNRAWFENAPIALLTVQAPLAAHATEPMQPCAPLVQAGPRLAAMRDAIALRAPVVTAGVASRAAA